MKKLIFLLAVAVLLSCCLLALASCGDEEDTSSASSSVSSTASASSDAESLEASSVEEVSSEATSTEETSSEETSSEESSLDPNAKPNDDGSNLALGKTYTRSLLYRQGDGSGDAGWGWDESKDIAYPDEGGVTLTDGVIPDDGATYSDSAWMGFSVNCPDYADGGYSWITVDLGESYQLSKLVLYTGGKKLSAGISAPASVEFLVSDDGENFTSVGSVTPEDGDDVTNAVAELTCSAAGRYVQIRIVGAGSWMFVSEFEAY